MKWNWDNIVAYRDYIVGAIARVTVAVGVVAAAAGGRIIEVGGV